ncbi:hypothetical protein LIER_03897 [Lithospermum erythrorhizon]|uniref:DUF4283 domain-containing protein n=1 Tax=Lithospermum erythrorhizon TaxID=34254 RepID=A0AAV3NUR4_LITER
MVKPQSEEGLTEGGGSYLAIEKAMKKKKKRKSTPPEEEVSNMVASNADPSLLVRVPQDNRVNVEGVLDEKMQKVVVEWEHNSSSLVAKVSCGDAMGNNAIEVDEITPKTAYVVALCSETEAVIQRDGGDKTQSVSSSLPVPPTNQSQVGNGTIGVGLVAPQSVEDVHLAPQTVKDFVVNSETGDVLNNVGGGTSQTGPVLQPLAGLRGLSSDGLLDAGKGLVFKAGNSDSGSGTNATGSNTGKPKLAGAMLQRARKALSRRSGARLGAGSVSTRLNPPNPLPIRPDTVVPLAAPTGPPEGAKVRPKFLEVIKDNRIVGNGLRLEHYDLMDNEDDVVLDENDEIPFVETWGYCLIGCFTGPFPGRQALNSLVKSWNVKCRIIPYAKGWTVFRFVTDEDRFRVFNGGPYLAFGKTLMLRLVDAGVILGDDLFTSVPTWVLFHDVPLSVWSESGLSKIASKVGIPMYTDKFTKERTKMSYARCLVDVDVSKPPVLEFGVKLPGGKRYNQKVTYECYPDYCCDCKAFGHNVFKCPKKAKVVNTPDIPPPVVPTKNPVVEPVPVVNPEPVIPPRIHCHRLLTRNWLFLHRLNRLLE